MLRIQVYTNPMYRGCSNHGITEEADHLTVVNIEGGAHCFPDSDAPPVLLVEHCGNPILVPAVADEGEWVPLRQGGLLDIFAGPGTGAGPTMGGAYAGSTDSRFTESIKDITGRHFYGAVAVHDRFETRAAHRSHGAALLTGSR
jgi:hypothetical protein